MAGFSRREVLRHLAFAGLAMAVPASAPDQSTADVLPPLASRLSRFFANGHSARAVGQRYLALTPDETDANLLTALICQSPENYRRLAAANAQQLQEFLSDQQRRDFAHGTTVTVDGWILSETEARLCAIAAIT